MPNFKHSTKSYHRRILFTDFSSYPRAKSEFALPLSPECKKIYVLLYDDYKLLIAKNPTTGEWEMV